MVQYDPRAVKELTKLDKPVAHPVFKTGGARQAALEGSTPSPFRMSDRELPGPVVAIDPGPAGAAEVAVCAMRAVSP